MTLFTNPNFIDHIVKSQGGEGIIDQQHYPILQTFIQLQTRSVLETAIKFMRNARRDTITLEDIQLAVKEAHNIQLTLPAGNKYIRKNQQIVREDPIISSPAQLMREQMKVLGKYCPYQPQLSGKWIYIQGKIPSTNQNTHLRSLSQLASSKEHQQAQRRQLFNVIKDDPYSLLTKEQLDYFVSITNLIATNPTPVPYFKVEGDLNNLLPFFLKYLGQTVPNQTGITFLLKLLCNKFIWAGVQFNLKKVLNILLVYKGPQSYDTGIKIAELVQRFSDKYPVLLDIYEGYQDQSYSTILKKIAFELYLGVPFQMQAKALSKCRFDSQFGDNMATLCMKVMMSHSSELCVFKKHLSETSNTFTYWHPCSELTNEPYLRMF